jgi:nucleotide-binding universal stress UspA family protein
MMSTHGYSPFRRLLLDSVTSKVLHDTACAVWTGAHVAQGPPAEWIKLGHIACAIDLGPHSASVLRRGASLAAEFKSRLTHAKIVRETGDVSKAVPAAAARLDADLVVIGRGA